MRKLRLDKKGLSGMVAVIVLLTLVLVLGAIIAGTLSGAPRPVMPAVTAVNLMTPYGGNPAAGDNRLIIRHEYGMPIADAWSIDQAPPAWMSWEQMRLLVNGEEQEVWDVRQTSKGIEVTGAGTYDFAVGDWMEIELKDNLQSSDLIQLVWVPRDMMLVEYLVQ